MITERYELETEYGTDAIEVTTWEDEEVTVRFFTDGEETGSPNTYVLPEDGGRLREYLNAYRHEGYVLVSTEREDDRSA